MEEEKWKREQRDKERGKRKEKGTSRSITVKWGVYRIRMRKKKSKCTHNQPTRVPFDDRKGLRGARIVGRDMARAASLGKRFRRKHKHTSERTSREAGATKMRMLHTLSSRRNNRMKTRENEHCQLPRSNFILLQDAAVDDLPPVLRQTDAHQREGLNLTGGRR